MDRRVVVTGYGCVTGAGRNAHDTWEAVQTGRSGIGRRTETGAADWQYPWAAEVRDYDAKTLVPDRKLLKAITRPDVLGLNAVSQALEHSGLLRHRADSADPSEFNDRTGIFVGAPASEYRQRYDFLGPLSASKGNPEAFADGAMSRVHPLWLLRTLPNNVLAYTGIHFGFKGANQNFTDHGVGGSRALAEARHQLSEGSIDRAVVVAFDSPAEPEATVYYGSAGLLSPTGIRPFDVGHDGTVLGEGAGALILESLDAARRRGADVYGELLGGGITSEATGVLGIRDDGDGLRRAIVGALDEAGTDPEAVGLVVAHGNGTPLSDTSESAALHSVFGLDGVPATGFKWALGHTIAASGVIESILALLCLRDGVAPAIPTLTARAPGCIGADVSNVARHTETSAALVITRGFSGLNSCLVLGRVASY